ncbi:TIGR01244 family sulfur transferase [Qingshengfaniella alkalisoli]|uniref:TIGR01244 family phosphatase n=1 Tax=Qingshengfaniella alkalisoli TaxID=2599296 RepID=A0A5B8ISF6_9RHOB|nr:TIGR01244 family sulfur transferase [Qingshengfaniella alkalisoli]QDY68524.1 TIGR01244 family phosphatase [Qingshengfaniella alkalisoli]
MDIRALSDNYAVSPQIEPHDIPLVKEAGFTTVICNRPDAEVPVELHAIAMRTAIEAAGLRFVENPVSPGAMTLDNVATQRDAMAAADGPVLAYCASGNRSSIVWSLVKAPDMALDEILAATTRAGYDHSGLRAQFEAFASQSD